MSNGQETSPAPAKTAGSRWDHARRRDPEEFTPFSHGILDEYLSLDYSSKDLMEDVLRDRFQYDLAGGISTRVSIGED